MRLHVWEATEGALAVEASPATPRERHGRGADGVAHIMLRRHGGCPCVGRQATGAAPAARPIRAGREIMSVARITEISSTSTKSFEDAVQQGIARSTKTLRNVTGAWIKEQSLSVSDGKITSYQVNLLVTFVLEDTI
ncbi:MAG: hypothetical protein NVSMB65_03980 [Chloroflexota bacterium]